MTHQPTLFDVNADVKPDYYDPTVSAGKKSKDAGKRNRDEVFIESIPKHAADHERIVAYAKVMGWRGATRDEISHVLSMPLATVCGRVRELVKNGVLVETDERRKTKTGSPAPVVRWAYAK